MLLSLLLACGSPTVVPAPSDPPTLEPVSLRVVSFNASLYGDDVGDLLERLQGDDSQARGVAEILQILRPDVVLVNELDSVELPEGERPADLLNTRYLAVGQNGREPLDFPHVYVAPSNTGVPTGFDLDGDGVVGQSPGETTARDSHGFGVFPGQYGFAVFSRFPLGTPRTFQQFRWTDLPGNQIPEGFYAPEAEAALRLSSKNHVDLPVLLDGAVLHVLASHPTPPAFDGPEDRNGRRNADEIRFWADYLDGGAESYHVDDAGVAGALQGGEAFVIVGDLNADPNDGSSRPGAIDVLLSHPLVRAEPAPTSAGATEQSEAQGRINDGHRTPAAQDTADFEDANVGNLRLDYALPSTSVELRDAGVFWPESTAPEFELVGTFPFPVSDHRAVWVDLAVPVTL